jgi:urease accessory protein
MARVLHSPAGFGGHPAIATVFYAAPDAPAHLATAREILEGVTSAKAAATAWDNILVTRFLASDIFLLRRATARFITGFRAHLGFAPVMPRFWSL